MKKGFILILSLVFTSSTLSLSAREFVGDKQSSGNKRSKSSPVGTAANCSPATASTELDINNTIALIQTGGDMWWDLVGVPRYEIPAGSGINALFAGSLWLGGEDVSGQLKLAALRFRSEGTDFWTGPLSTQTSEIDAATCLEWDEHFVTTRDEVSEFVGWYEAGVYDAENGTETQSENYPDYSVPESITNWPAHGRNYAPYNEDYNLAPFYDRDGDGTYDPNAGDYPRYELSSDADCGQRIVDIYGDKNLWWIFNDKGNIHSETSGDPIGMEIRAQAFGFATNDEVNNMTFYNYELVNRSSYTLQETYFGFWVDADLGNAQDDYVGCDVQRGLGYAYNGDENDEDNGGSAGYGEQPPAIGVDFFQGPYQDNDGLDNPGPETNTDYLDYNTAFNGDGIPYKGLGVGYGDGEVDNERLGMRAFLYYNNDNSIRGEPNSAAQYYNYLRSYWKDNSKMRYGGTGHISSSGADPNVEADFMFPGDSDPIGWGTGGNPQSSWTEVTAGNTPFDRRFIQSSGPFTLTPGAVNNITVGVVWSRATSGGANASVETLRTADDKTQALFDNCFQILNGPEAPELSVIELDKELILTIDNFSNSNNYNEEYTEVDPFNIPPDNLSEEEKRIYTSYNFQGYQIFQLKDESVSSGELFDVDKARLVAQCDIKDSVTDLINFTYDNDLQANVPEQKVENAANDGIYKSFRITTDAFAEGDNRLVNHKTYYFMAIAYAFNQYKEYKQVDGFLDGQTEPYLASRKGVSGALQIKTGIPHISDPKYGGTRLNAAYGDGVEITRIEGLGNGGINVEMSQESIDEIMSGEPWRVKQPVYEKGAGPIEVKVYDPLNVKGGTYTVAFIDTNSTQDLSDAYWVLYGEGLEDTITASASIKLSSEVLIPELGVSMLITQADTSGSSSATDLGFISSTMEFANNDAQWLTGVANYDGNNYQNWIRSGSSAEEDYPEYIDYALEFDASGNREGTPIDPDQVYETILDGTCAPSRMTTWNTHGPLPLANGLVDIDDIYMKAEGTEPASWQLQYLRDVNIYITSDKSKWTRVPVIEMHDDPSNAVGNALKGSMRKSLSVDKDGNPADTTNGAGASDNPDSPNYISPVGMGWFPGYAIDLMSGERLNMAFGEDSWLVAENGNDMLWNPTSTTYVGEGAGNVRFGGKHFIYVFRNNIVEENTDDRPYNVTSVPKYGFAEFRMPSYDYGQFMVDKLSTGNKIDFVDVWRASMWTGFPLLAEGYSILDSDVTIKLRTNSRYQPYGTGEYLNPGDPLIPGEKYMVDAGPVSYNGQEYERYDVITATDSALTFTNVNQDTANLLITSVNGGLPMYQFNLDALATENNINTVAESALDEIYIVPNPYYAYSQYEEDKLDNRVKIINLPKQCNIKIYTMGGTLVRELTKDDESITSIDWDLKNHARIPIASGMYIIHVDVPGVGEKVLKWFGVMRPVDLDSF